LQVFAGTGESVRLRIKSIFEKEGHGLFSTIGAWDFKRTFCHIWELKA